MGCLIRRRRHMLILAIASIVTCSTLYMIMMPRSIFSDYLRLLYLRSLADDHYLVNTPSCMIPDIDPFGGMSRRALGDPAPQDNPYCDRALPMVTDVIDGDTIRINVTLKDQLGVSHCKYQQIHWNSDYKVTYNTPVKFTGDVKPPADFVRVQCYGKDARRVYSNFHALTGRKEDVEQRCDEKYKIYLDNGHRSEDDVWNVLMVGVDSMSRLNSIRRLGATRRLLFKHMQIVELRGFNRIGDNSYANFMALMTGNLANERPPGGVDKTPFLWIPFADAGYRTLYVDNGHSLEWHNMKGFSTVPVDYYFRTMAVAQHGDTNSEAVSRWYEGPACIGPTFVTDLVLDWMYNFVQEMNSRRSPYFAYGLFSRLTHDNANSAVWLDMFLERFFGRLFSVNALANTVIVFFSDHGSRYGPSRANSWLGLYEENSPMALIALPPSFRHRHGAMFETLQSNNGSLTTHLDVHETIRRLLTVNQPLASLERADNRSQRRRGVSLFDSTIEDRSCEQASITPLYCGCLLSSITPLNTDSDEVQEAVGQTIKKMNTILAIYKGLCSELQLVKVTDAKVKRHKEASSGRGMPTNYYIVIYHTTPGGGIFQAMVKYEGGREKKQNTTSIDIQGDVLRLNAYANQSGCIDHVVHKKWCHCTNNIH